MWQLKPGCMFERQGLETLLLVFIFPCMRIAVTTLERGSGTFRLTFPQNIISAKLVKLYNPLFVQPGSLHKKRIPPSEPHYASGGQCF